MMFHLYIFFRHDSRLYDLEKASADRLRKEISKVLNTSKDIVIYSYVTLGFKANTRVLLWLQSDTPENLQDFVKTITSTGLGKYLSITHTLLGIARPSQYSKTDHMDTSRKGGKYLIIYPFSKTHEWYMLDFKKRKSLMAGHIAIGRKYPQITQLLLYSYGIDDNEFIVSYETDNLVEFQQLVMELRTDAVRAYTLKDTPIFTCIYSPIEEWITNI